MALNNVSTSTHTNHRSLLRIIIAVLKFSIIPTLKLSSNDIPYEIDATSSYSDSS